MAVVALPVELARLTRNPRLTRSVRAKERCEASFLDFVELMWPVVDPGQPFVRGRVQEAIAMHLEAVTAGTIKNLLATVPPGSTKTYLVNVFWPAWEWGPKNRPDLRYMSWSYSPKLTLKANEDCRKIIKSEVYQRFWGDRFRLDETSDAKEYFTNDKGGWRRASSVKGGTTGFRADRLIWDDPHNIKDANSPAALLEATTWFSKSLPTRVRNANGEVDIRVPFWVRDVHGTLPDDPDDPRPVTVSAVVGIMQRVHLHDIAGIVLKNPALGYEVLLIEMRFKGGEHPARKLETWRGSSIGYEDWRTSIGDLAEPVRYPEHAVAALEAALMLLGGSDAVAAQLDQWPQQIGGTMFTAEWLPIIEPNQVPVGIDKRGWDFAGSKAKKADQTATACVRRGSVNKRFYLMDSAAIRGGPAEVDDFVRARHRDDPVGLDWSIPRDPGATGIHFAEYVVRELAPGRYVTSSPELGKIQSAKPVSAQAAHGNFFIVRHPGCEITRSQMIDFPYGDYDDLMDAISRALAAHVHESGVIGDSTPITGMTDDVIMPRGPSDSPRYDFDL